MTKVLPVMRFAQVCWSGGEDWLQLPKEWTLSGNPTCEHQRKRENGFCARFAFLKPQPCSLGPAVVKRH